MACRQHAARLALAVLSCAVAASRSTGVVVDGSAEAFQATQVDARKANFFSSGFRFRLPPAVSGVIIDIGLCDQILKPGPRQHVIAIEASVRETVANNLPRLCELMGNCTFLLAAIGDGTDRLVQLWDSSTGGGPASITAANPAFWPHDRSPSVVPLLPLSSVIDAIPQHVQLSFCKVDTNGNDVLVLRSAGDSIRRCREVRVEIATGGQAGPLNQHETAVEWLRAKGFDMHEQTRVLNVYRGGKKGQQYDLIFWKSGAQRARLRGTLRSDKLGLKRAE